MLPSLLRAFLCSFLLLFFICEHCQVDGRRGFGDTEQDWGYVTVRPHAHMFWWLYYTTHSGSSYTHCPLIIWLQGGPGVPSSGYGVFSEMGPLDVNVEKREHNFLKDFNLLFIDNPVGVGFSYFSNATKEAKSIESIGKDLVTFLKAFLNEHTEFEDVPTYIFGESYGGKMAAEFANQIILQKQKGTMRCNLKGIGLGNSYISPIDYISFYAPLTYHLGFLDEHGHNVITAKVRRLKRLINAGKYEEASELENIITSSLGNLMSGVDLYNFMERSNATAPSSFWKREDELNSLLNEKVKPALNISSNLDWKFFSDETYCHLKTDFLKPVTKQIENLLNNTDTKVIVYNGALDILVNTAGTTKWLSRLNWKHSAEWSNSTQSAFVINEITEGYVKEVGNLVFYSISRAGHSVPIDNPAAMDYILTPIKTN